MGKKTKGAKSVGILTSKLPFKTVTWLDAVQREVPTEYFEGLTSNSTCKHLLATNKTYGKIKAVKDTVFIIHEDSTDENTDITIVPNHG